MDTTTRCSGRVYDRASAIRGRACTNRAVVERAETRVERTPRKVYDEATFSFTTEYDERTVQITAAYCRQHDPVARKEKEDRRKEKEDRRYAEEKRARGAKLGREDALLARSRRLVERLKALGVVANEPYVQDQSPDASRYRTTPTGAVVVGAEGVELLLGLARRTLEYESVKEEAL